VPPIGFVAWSQGDSGKFLAFFQRGASAQ